MRAHQQAAFRLAYLLTGDPAAADDVAQEAFIRAYHALARFDATRPFRPWLMRITANLAHNQRRSAGRYLAALQRLLRAEPKSAPPPTPAADRLWQAVRRLTAADQEIIYLRYFLEMSEAELIVRPGEKTKWPSGVRRRSAEGPAWENSVATMGRVPAGSRWVYVRRYV